MWPAAAGRSTARDQGPTLDLVARASDWCTIAAVATSTMPGLDVGQITLADVFFGFAALGRIAQFLGPGIDFAEIRRHGFLLTIIGVFTFGGVVAGIANGNPLQWDFIRIVIATLGSIFVVATYTTSDERIRRLLTVFCLSGVGLAFSGFVMAAPGGRMTGLSIHPNGLAHSLIMSILGALYLVEQSRNRRARILWGLAIVLEVAALMESGSRGSLLGLGAGLFIYCVLSNDRRAVLAALACIWVVGSVVALNVVDLPDNNPISRFGAGSGGSDLDREIQLDRALEKIREDPLFGDGFQGIIIVHVVYFQGWVGAGAIGAISLMSLGLAFLVWPLFQPRRTLVLACALTAVGVAWLFTNILSFRDQWVFLALAFRMTTSPLELLAQRRA